MDVQLLRAVHAARQRRTTPGLAAVLPVIASLALAACVSVDVKSVGTEPGRVAFDLSGTDLGTLAVEAARLCPQGHEVLRQWTRYARTAGDGGGDPTSAALWAAAFSYDTPPPSAQMSILCRPLS